jgi:hypothetical protein
MQTRNPFVARTIEAGKGIERRRSGSLRNRKLQYRRGPILNAYSGFHRVDVKAYGVIGGDR